ncbi:hypothetical protein J8I87_42505 [Paraburkholderia sp. LEh10]|uniref:recombination directionality factor n=1 Tax=Paraburkholderia sp. LEh10 TaxID=2821353 RepID=UPI001AE681B8|nr:hypothetical protein [Paraburkholderia sp. LEh10]MBP0596159.1 hypothetical protein [Paraburkholderia sp. LEh10]
MVSGLEFDTPILGTVRMGDVRTGEAGAPDELLHFDYFEVHTRRKSPDGTWAKHLLHDQLLEKLAETRLGEEGEGQKGIRLREIPIQLPYNNPELLLTQQLEARRLSDGKRVCVGDGQTAIRIIDVNRAQEAECPGCDQCPFGNTQDVFCQRRTSLIFRIEGQGDPFSVFVLHSAGKNTAQTLVAKLHAMHAAFGGRLVGIPMSLKMRNTASADAMGGPVFYADLVLRRGMAPFDAVRMAVEYEKEQQEAGFDQERLEKAMLELKRNSQFAPPEEFGEVRDFYGRGIVPSPQEKNAQPSHVAAGYPHQVLAGGPGTAGEQITGERVPRLSEVAPVSGARHRMRVAAQTAASIEQPQDEPETDTVATGAVQRVRPLQLVPAPVIGVVEAAGVVSSAVSPLSPGAPITRVAMEELASIPEMPRSNAQATAF